MMHRIYQINNLKRIIQTVLSVHHFFQRRAIINNNPKRFDSFPFS